MAYICLTVRLTNHAGIKSRP